MRTRLTTVLTLSAAAALAVAVAPATASADNGRTGDSSASGQDRLQAIGLAGDRTLVSFDTGKADRGRALGDVQGLAPGDQDLVGIDYRVQDGMLYAVGRSGGVYAVDTRTLKATKVLQLTVALDGTNFGVDFNPAANALRIVSDKGQNLRQPFAAPAGSPAGTPVPGTVTDTSLTLVAPPAAPAPGTGVTGVAYTNNDLDPATSTTLFGLATNTDQVVIQAPANAGTLSATGATGVDLTGDTGFDIYTSTGGRSAGQLSAFAVNGGKLYAVDLLRGRFTEAGRIGGGQVTDIAIPLGQR
jgi:hypothetical protein